MESSAFVYIGLLFVTVFLALFVKNEEHARQCILDAPKYGRDTYFSRGDARNLVAVIAIYLLMTGVSACRIAVGNDYWVYRQNFELIMQNRLVASEFGFNAIVKGIQTIFGYDKYLPVFGFFSIITVYFFVKALKDQATDFAFSLFLLMTNGYYFNSLNSVRYYLALAIAILSMKYVLRGEYLKFFAWIVFGAFFHKTIFFVIPFFLVAAYFSKHKIRIWHSIVAGIAISSLIWGQGLYRMIIFKFYPFYENSAFDMSKLSLVNIGKCVCVLALGGICYKKSLKEDRVNRFYYLLTAMGLVVFLSGSFVPEVSRLGFYLIAAQIFLIPGILNQMEKGIFRTLCKTGVVVCFVLYFALQIKGMYATNVRLLPYLNWIFN